MIRRLLRPEALAKGLFAFSTLMLALGYGIVATPYALFPTPQIRSASAALVQLLVDFGIRQPWYFSETRETTPARVVAADAMSPGLTLVSGLASDGTTAAKVVDAQGRVIHRWHIDWFEIWPNPTHLPAGAGPKSIRAPVLGMQLMPNGDLVFNFNDLGGVRLDACGGVVWRLPYRTHHSVHLDEGGHLWIPGIITHLEPVARLPNHVPPFEEYSVLELSADGRIVSELSVFDLLLENGLRGLLHMSTTRNLSTDVSGDTLHLNDVETFPASLPAGVFQPGDVMISLRNINAIVVFDPRTRRIKFMTVGKVLRQHDPDFVDGNTISVFDNNNLAVVDRQFIPDRDELLVRPSANGHFSRIVTISAKDESVGVRFEGTADRPFFTAMVGNHETLPNGNILIVESLAGRVFEVDAQGRIVWEYFNLVRDGVVGLVDDAFRLPPSLDQSFFARASAACDLTDGRVRH